MTEHLLPIVTDMAILHYPASEVVKRMERRNLRFGSLDEVLADATHLSETELQAVGKWNFAQICEHLADWMRFPVDGFPRKAFPIRAILWMMKVTIGKSTIKKILATESMKAGTPTMPDTVKPADVSSNAAALEQLAQAIENFKNHSGEFHPSPIFGALSREDALKLQLIHCAHHLSFLVPVDANE